MFLKIAFSGESLTEPTQAFGVCVLESERAKLDQTSKFQVSKTIDLLCNVQETACMWDQYNNEFRSARRWYSKSRVIVTNYEFSLATIFGQKVSRFLKTSLEAGQNGRMLIDNLGQDLNPVRSFWSLYASKH